MQNDIIEEINETQEVNRIINNKTTDNIIKAVLKELKKFFSMYGNTGAYEDSLNVLSHIDKAISESQNMSSNRILAMRLAALLHNVDDSKYLKKRKKKNNSNAIKIMINVGTPFFGSSVISEAVQMIKLISWSFAYNCENELSEYLIFSHKQALVVNSG